MRMKSSRSAIEWSLIAAGVVVIALTLHPAILGDAAVRYQTIEYWLGEGGGYSKFSVIQPALSMPLAWLANAVGIDPTHLVAYFNALVFLVMGAAAYPELARRYSPETGRVWLLLMMAASMFPHHLQHYYGEVLTSLCLLLGILWLSHRSLIAVLLLALACVSTPALLVPFAAVAFVWLLVHRSPLPMLALFIAGAIILGETLIKYGGLDSGYLSDGEHGFATVLPYSGRPGFSYPMFFGVLSLLMSFGKGLVFYIPALVLVLSRRVREMLRLDVRSTWIALAALVLPILFYSKWWAWYGGAFWGPRFFLYLCAPACLLIALSMHDRAIAWPLRLLVIAILVLSAWVAIDGYLYGQEQMDACWADNYSKEYLCWYLPEFSALWRPFVTGSFWHMMSNVRWPYAAWNLLVIGYLLARVLVGSHGRDPPPRPLSAVAKNSALS